MNEEENDDKEKDVSHLHSLSNEQLIKYLKSETDYDKKSIIYDVLISKGWKEKDAEERAEVFIYRHLYQKDIEKFENSGMNAIDFIITLLTPRNQLDYVLEFDQYFEELARIKDQKIGRIIFSFYDSYEENPYDIVRGLLINEWKPESKEEKVIFSILIDEWNDIIEMGEEAIEAIVSILVSTPYKLPEDIIPFLLKIDENKAIDAYLKIIESVDKDFDDQYFYLSEDSARELVKVNDKRKYEGLINFLNIQYKKNADFFVYYFVDRKRFLDGESIDYDFYAEPISTLLYHKEEAFKSLLEALRRDDYLAKEYLAEIFAYQKQKKALHVLIKELMNTKNKKFDYCSEILFTALFRIDFKKSNEVLIKYLSKNKTIKFKELDYLATRMAKFHEEAVQWLKYNKKNFDLIHTISNTDEEHLALFEESWQSLLEKEEGSDSQKESLVSHLYEYLRLFQIFGPKFLRKKRKKNQPPPDFLKFL